MQRTLAPVAIAAGLLIAGCSATDDGPTVAAPAPAGSNTSEPTRLGASADGETGGRSGGTPADGQGADDMPAVFGLQRVAMQQFDECGSLLDHLHTVGAEMVGPWGFDGGGYWGWPGDVMFAEEAPAEESASEDSAATVPAAAAPPATDSPAAAVVETDGGGESFDTQDGAGDDGTFSTTNVQVEGVDEPDIIKTDGSRVLAISQNRLYLATVEDGRDGTLRSSVDLFADNNGYSSWGSEILFNGDRAFVIGQSEYWGQPVDDFVVFDDAAAVGSSIDDSTDDATSEAIPVEPDEPIGGPIPRPSPYRGPTTTIHEVDLSNPDAIQIVSRLEVRGRYVSARSVGATARVVVTSAPVDLGFVYPSNDSEQAWTTATEANQRIVAESTIEQWLPTYLLSGRGGTSQGQLVDCANVHAPDAFSGFDMLSVVSFDTDKSLADPAGTSTVMATGDTVYTSQDRLYVATNVWMPPTLNDAQREQWSQEVRTHVHRFSITKGEPAVYEASGSVDGQLVNQFAMNDRDGTLYVATTIGDMWAGGSESQIVALQIGGDDGDELLPVGRVGGLGIDERIFSVRYVDDLAYVVTFREVDPFYVVDLSDPTDMVVRGELKIPGYSSYLHPITPNLVLGVGQDATDEGFTTGAKVSLFDVSDRSNPTELDVWTLPNSGTDVEWDHRAFLYWPSTEIAVLPVNVWNEGFLGAVVLRVNADGIEELGRIDNAGDEQTGISDCDVLPTETLTEEDGELFWISREGRVLLCNDGEVGGATGYTCDVFDLEFDGGWMFEGEVPADVAAYDRIELCWNSGGWEHRITRTLVLESALWSLSDTRLVAHDLATLERIDVVEFAGS